MWNVPYVIAFKNPIKFMTSYLEAVILQLFGLVSESIDVLNSCGPVSLQSSVTRFILFDYIGLILLLTGFLVLKKMQKKRRFSIGVFLVLFCFILLLNCYTQWHIRYSLCWYFFSRNNFSRDNFSRDNYSRRWC